jgi:transposase-like protein
MQKTLTAKQQFWFDHVTAAQHGGQSLSVYAAIHQLNLKALYNWRWTFSKRDLSAPIKKTFIKVLPTSSRILTTTPAPIIATLPNGIRLQFDVLTPEVLALLRSC